MTYECQPWPLYRLLSSTQDENEHPGEKDRSSRTVQCTVYFALGQRLSDAVEALQQETCCQSVLKQDELLSL